MKHTFFSLLTAAAFLTACGGSTAPGSQVSLSFSGGASVSSPNPGFMSAAPRATDNAGNVIVISTAEIVLRKIKLKRQEVVDCDVDPEPAGCQDFVVGAQLIGLPTDGTVKTEVTVELDPGTYTEVEFEVHKVSNDDPEDADFRAAHPEHVGLSIKVVGTYNGDPFTYTTDLNEKQEFVFVDPLVVGEGGASRNVTIELNLDTWFIDAQLNLIDPDTANKGGDNENLVKDNIKASIDAFDDDDKDGERG
jgi:hypothetical protein